jgi:hypothetical protein
MHNNIDAKKVPFQAKFIFIQVYILVETIISLVTIYPIVRYSGKC